MLAIKRERGSEREAKARRGWVAAGNEGERKTREDAERKQLSRGIRMRWRHLTGRESCSLRLSLHRRPRATLPSPSPPPHAIMSLGRLAAAAGRMHVSPLPLLLALQVCLFPVEVLNMERPLNTKPLCVYVYIDLVIWYQNQTIL